ncbi:hypothetical protein IHV09_19430 [Fictibacillus sp. 23RED33]|uniref:hypothetical protein n=1 Tax=Fictibacillus sp. 23RED33 TaxID=2745879 RepID=UPI0018CFD057|nr:hypothetical protein [Fictibacillus sp. 23RED33]MBH0175749.1 hypothetical protein [Fictibacillus sp. 23RED33]
METKTRKIRSDKKRDGQTDTIKSSQRLYFSRILHTPVKDVDETLCEKGLQLRNVLEYLSQFFQRDLQFVKTVLYGRLGIIIKESTIRENERITIRFTKASYSLSRALDATPSKATALLDG